MFSDHFPYKDALGKRRRIWEFKRKENLLELAVVKEEWLQDLPL